MKVDPAPYVGQEILRREDHRLVTGTGRYVADIRLPGMVEAAFVRSPHPHADITGIDTSAARSMPGIVDVVTAPDLVGAMEPLTEPISRDASNPDLVKAIALKIRPFHMPLLVDSRVLRQGEPVAIVVAPDRYLAEDAARAVDVRYRRLPAVMDPLRALEPDAPILHDGASDNVHASFHVREGDVERAFATAHATLSVRLKIGRVVGSPIECRGTVADFDPATRSLTVWSTHQRPHFYRRFLSATLGISEENIRAITPDMGGSFGGGMYPEEFLVPFLARRLGRPVRWIEDRRENLENARHARDQIHDIEVAFQEDGTILAIRDDFVVDYGAYNPFGVAVPYNTTSHLRGQYRIEGFEVRARGVYTNKTPNTVLRGAGRPEASFVIERVMDLVARKLGMDPIAIRRRNLIRAEEMPFAYEIPYSYGYPLVLDTGDYPQQLESALDMLDLEAARAHQRAARAQGRRVGIGVSSYLEGSGFGPPEVALARLEPDGRIAIFSGSAPHGQSHETTLAQVAADALGIDIDLLYVRAGDTGLLEGGGGTFASRSAVLAGSAVHNAAAGLRAAIIERGARMMSVDPADVDLNRDGTVRSRRDAGAFLDLSSLAKEGPLEETARFVSKRVTFSSGTHVAVVEVDEATGKVAIQRYIVAHECGRMLNPAIVEGQIIGGVAHGIGTALFEEVVYDEDGHLATPTLFTYLLPTAPEIPSVEIVHQEFPSSTNPLGAKGAGEGGATGSPGAIANAVEDALADLGIRITEIPLTPERVLAYIEAARSAST